VHHLQQTACTHPSSIHQIIFFLHVCGKRTERPDFS
jgi:hypothetical protein